MNTFLRLLSIEEASFLYQKQLQKDFPADELKPWKNIARMWEQDAYFAVGLFEDPGQAGDASLLGYAFLVAPDDCDAWLLDYFAILPERRDAGLGGRTLQRLSEMARDRGKYMLLETEDVDYAENDRQIAERTRRDAFYARNGCEKTDIRGSVFGVRYAVWRLGGPDDFDLICNDMDTLYRLMIPGGKNAGSVEIRRTP